MWHSFGAVKILKYFKITALLQKLRQFAGSSRFGLVVELLWGGSATNGATMSSFMVGISVNIKCIAIS